MQQQILIALLSLMGIASSAHAERVMSHYDLDSLCYLSQTIVRAEVGDSTTFKTVDGDCVAHDVTVREVFKGTVKPDETFRVTGLDRFYHAPGMHGRENNWDPIQKGDAVYLFLVTNDKARYSTYRETDPKWTVIESGARLLSDKFVYAFTQSFWNLHGMVAMTRAAFPNAPVFSREIFEGQLKKSFQTNEQVTQLLATKPSPLRHDAILKMLKGRPSALNLEIAANDAIGIRLLEGLGEDASPAELVSLLENMPWDTTWQLENRLQANAGRTYLMRRISNSEESQTNKVRFAEILSTAGSTYVNDLIGLTASEPEKLRSDFATSMAKLAADNLGTALGAPLINGIAGCAIARTSGKSRLMEDLHHAAKILSESFAEARPDDQYLIAQTLMQIDPEVYRQTLPHAGLLLTQLKPDTDFIEAFKGRTLHMTCDFFNQFKVPRKIILIARPVDGGSDVHISVDTNLGEITNNFGQGWTIKAAIPDACAGTYRLFLRNCGDGQPDGDGLGVEVNIPQK